MATKKTELAEVATFLTQRDIPVISEESLLLENSLRVRCLVAFIQFLTDTENEIIRSNFLLSLYHVFPTWDVTQFQEKNLPLKSPKFLEALSQQGFDFTFVQQPMLTFYDWMEAASRVLVPAGESDSYVHYFLDAVLQFIQGREDSPQEFLNHWEQVRSKKSVKLPDGFNAVRLMTIHKSKGLQFNVVMIPFAYWGTKSDGIWVPLEHKTFSSFYINSLTDYEYFPDGIREIAENEEQLALLDSVNVLYVATTRAVEQLYISSQKLKKNSDSKNELLKNLNNFVDEYGKGDRYIFGDPKRVISKDKSTNDEMLTETIEFISSDWTNKIRVSQNHVLLWDNERQQSISFGNKMHYVLENLSSPDQLENVLENLLLQGYLNKNESNEIKHKLQNLFEQPDLVDIFSSDETLNERDFISRQGETFRPDKLTKVGEEWILIDYKTGSEEKSHQQQIKNYSILLNELGYSISKMLLIYFGDEVKVKEVK